MLELFGSVWAWSQEHPWRSAMFHALFAVPVAYFFGTYACLVAFGLMEVKEWMQEEATGAKPRWWWKHFSDFAAPLLVSILLSALGWF